MGEDLGHGLTELGHPRRPADDLDTVQGFRKAITLCRYFLETLGDSVERLLTQCF